MKQHNYKKRKISKKGFLFSTISLTLLALLLLFSSLYAKEIHSRSNRSVDEFKLIREEFIEKEIAYNFLNILNISYKNSTITDKNTSIYFSKFTNLGVINLNILDKYEKFLEGNYSKKINQEIDLSDFNPSFYIYPFESLWSVNETNITILTSENNNIERIEITLKINSSISSNITPTEDSSGSFLYIKIIDPEGNKFNFEGLLNRSDTDNEIKVLNSTNYLSINYGNINQNGTLSITTEGLSADIYNFSVTYNKSSNFLIYTKAYLNMSYKNGRIKLIE